MSTVDAAIIDFVVNNPGSGTGTKYTAGNAIDLTSNKISVKYDPATMQLVDGKISALPQSGGTGVVLSAGDAINIADNKISVKYDTNSMELKDGKLAAKTGLSTDKSSLGFDKNGYLLYDGVAKENVSFRLCAEDTENGDILMMSHYNKTDNYKLTTLNVTDAARFYIDSTNGVQNTNSLQFFKDGTIEAMNDANKITIKANTVDIQGTLLHNGLAAGSSSIPTEDVYTKIEGLTAELYKGSEETYSLRIRGLTSSDIKTGNVIRIAYDDGTENTWFIIRNSFMKDDSNGNAMFNIIDANTGTYIYSAYYYNNGDSYELKVYAESGKNFATPTEEHGLYRMDEMSLRTMQLLIMNQYTTWFN